MLPLLGKCKLTNEEHEKKNPSLPGARKLFDGSVLRPQRYARNQAGAGRCRQPFAGGCSRTGICRDPGEGTAPGSYPGRGVQSIISCFLPSSQTSSEILHI